MRTQSSRRCYLGTLIIGVTAAVASCLLALSSTSGAWAQEGTTQQTTQATSQRVLGAFTRDDIVSFNQTVGRPARIVHYFQDWKGSTGGGNDFDPAMMNRAVDSGGLPMVTWMSGDLTQGGATQPYYSNKNIYLNKKFDSYITTWATAARDWGNSCAEARGASSPCVMFLRFDHEMNGNWFPWSPGVNGNTHYDYVRAWRHVHDIFAKVGAKNVRWVWSGSQCTTSSCSSLSASYPGDSYVNWTALSGYNRQPGQWRTGSEIFRPNYDLITGRIAPGKPFMIAEVGSREDPDQPYRKANWLLQFFNSEIPNRLPKTKAVVYYSVDTSAVIPGTNLEVDSSPESLAAYRKVAASWGWSGTLLSTDSSTDDTPPQTTITSKPPSATRSTSASFKFASSKPLSTFKCSRDGGAYVGCSANPTYYSLSNGTHTLRVTATDAEGNTDSTPATWTWKVDTVRPTGSVLIKDGERRTAKRTVTLKLGASDPSPASGVSHMRFRNEGTTTWTSWQAYAASKSWLLSSGAGKKTVYVQYKDRAGNVSYSRSDAITYRP